MSKLAENIIKNAYQNRANAVIAAKQAADEGKLQKAMQWMKDPANKGKATAIESGLGGLAAGGLGFGLTKALGGSTGRAWANAGIAGGSTAAGVAGLKYRKEIGDALRGILKKKKEEPRTEPSNGLELRSLDELKKENSNLALGQQTSTVLAQMAANAKEIERREKELGPIEQQLAMMNDGNPEHAQLMSELQAKQSDLRQGRGSKYTVTKNDQPNIPIGSRSGNWNPDGTVKP